MTFIDDFFFLLANRIIITVTILLKTISTISFYFDFETKQTILTYVPRRRMLLLCNLARLRKNYVVPGKRNERFLDLLFFFPAFLA